MSDLPVNRLLSVSQAIAIIDATPVSPRIERIRIEQANGRRLATDIRADRDDPPFDKSLMDGFAVRSGDGRTLRIVGDIPAGTSAKTGIRRGQTMSIMTGAPLPVGADAVVPVEQTVRDGESVNLAVDPKSGQSIAGRGSDCAAGTVVLLSGILLGPAQIAVAASVGAAMVDVFARPRVALLSTGDEIVAVDQRPGVAQIRNSNSYMLRALLVGLGCEVVYLGIVADEPGLIRSKMEEGFSSDALFVTGGMSMGEYDYVPRLLGEMGVDLRISKVRIKPGKPFVFGVRENKFVFGLPGNPVSGYVCTLRLAARLLARMGGADEIPQYASKEAPHVQMGLLQDISFAAILRTSLPTNGPREFYQPGILDNDGGIEPLQWKGSADIYTLSAANALIIREENAPAAAPGSTVRIIRMP